MKLPQLTLQISPALYILATEHLAIWLMYFLSVLETTYTVVYIFFKFCL